MADQLGWAPQARTGGEGGENARGGSPDGTTMEKLQ